MNIEGLDYNTQREKLVLPEYGREIKKMVDHAMSLPTKEERQRCANTIIDIMERMVPQNRDNQDYKHKLWDHLALLSNYQLDIDWPYDVSGAQQITAKPEPLGYPMTHIPVRHYGKMMFEIFEKLKTMPAGEERDELVRVTANQMKQNLYQWSHGSADDEKVISDMVRFTDGKIQIDIDTFKFDKIQPREPEVKKKGKRR
ncbi:MAG: DUF4290 domain-containing protein [Prevotella sp.]|nr:DUF4290 domain-containing protein [Prevotella sp.]